ncbi:hypothetical protein, partial [Endozoicomonas sp.]|uniref:hypothetical protein n=1 Tax=Endozoicomonas sp. TaxID=1892382 RepID=UPI00383BC78A
MNLNNSNGSALPVDGQFMTPDGQFWLAVEDVNITTNARFTRYNLPLLLSYKAGLNDSSTIGLPETFYRLSLEYQNEINNQELVQVSQSNPIPAQLEEEGNLVAIADSWLANLPATAAGFDGSSGGDAEYEAEQSEEEDEYWLISEPGVEKES